MQGTLFCAQFQHIWNRCLLNHIQQGRRSMSDSYRPRSLMEIMNDVLSTVRDYYDAEYAYYIEKEQGDIETIYEWCAENVEWQRDRLRKTSSRAG